MSSRGKLLAATSLSPVAPGISLKPKRHAYRCSVTNEEIEDMGPNPTWADWKALFMSKDIPPMRLFEGADFRMADTPGGVAIEFP